MARPAGHRLNRFAWDDISIDKGLSPTVVAELSGVPRVTVASLIGGHHKASVPMAHKIASACGVHPAHLFPSLARCFSSDDEACELELMAEGKAS